MVDFAKRHRTRVRPPSPGGHDLGSGSGDFVRGVGGSAHPEDCGLRSRREPKSCSRRQHQHHPLIPPLAGSERGCDCVFAGGAGSQALGAPAALLSRRRRRRRRRRQRRQRRRRRSNCVVGVFSVRARVASATSSARVVSSSGIVASPPHPAARRGSRARSSNAGKASNARISSAAGTARHSPAEDEPEPRVVEVHQEPGLFGAAETDVTDALLSPNLASVR